MHARLVIAIGLIALVLFGAGSPPALRAQTPTPVAASTNIAAQGRILQNANLRSGPGTTFPVIGGARAGQTVTITGANADRSWVQLDTDAWLAAFLVELSPAGSAPTATASRPYAMPPIATLTAASVVRIVDGDTIRIRLGGAEYPVRYIGMDTPEVGRPFAAQATATNRALVEDKMVYLERDVSETDRYNRLLRYIWLADGTLVNYELVRQGYAQVATFPPDVKHIPLFQEAQRQAEREGVGLWATSAQPANTPRPATAPATPRPSGPSAAGNANLRGGPGTQYPVVGSVAAGQALEVAGRNAAGDWVYLASGVWIAAFLVSNAPSGLPVISAPAPPAAPSAPVPPAQPAAVCDCSYNRFNCPDFRSQAEAQACFNYCRSIGRGDIHRLDGDNDGLACESLP